VTDPNAGAGSGGELQFDRAEHAAAPAEMTCGPCGQPVGATYYEVNGSVTCQRCRALILAAWNRGSPRKRFAKALALGGAAAALGAGVYFGIEALTGYEFGLVAIVVGLIVGTAVRTGSNGRGGWRYQGLAMFLTYSAVVATDSSLIARELAKEFRGRAASITAQPDSNPALAATTAGTQARSDIAPRKAAKRPRVLTFALGLLVLLALTYAAPIIIGLSSPLHLVIAGFALYEAWKLNRGAPLRITGPYQARARTAPA
jgi:hypothetical protein